MCVGISVSCMPLIARLYKAKNQKLKSNFASAGERFKNMVFTAKPKNASEKVDVDPKAGNYARIEAFGQEAGTALKTPGVLIVNPARLNVHITGATMSFASQHSVV